MKSYANFIYSKGNFSAGTRFEGYLNTLQGFEPKNQGVGFPYRWAKYVELLFAMSCLRSDSALSN